MFPDSYKLKWRLLNAMIKFIEILSKDLGNKAPNLEESRRIAKIVAARWAPKAILHDCPDVKTAWTEGRAALDEQLQKLIEAVSPLAADVQSDCLPNTAQAYNYIIGKYSDAFFQTYCNLNPITDKQLIKALNTLRAKKDCILTY